MAFKDLKTNQEKLAWLASDPVRFAQGLLGHRTWKKQEQILRSIANNRLTAVKACNASSKTFTAAEAALWWVTNYKDGIVITTAPTDTQVRKLLWGEIHKASKNGRVIFPDLNQKELSLGPDNYALGMSTNEGVRFHGFHGNVLIIFDEAPGIRVEIWEALEGIRAGGNVHVLVLGNPLVSSGPFYDIFTSRRSGWKTFSISAFDTPNFQGLNICNYHLQKTDDKAHCYKRCFLRLKEDELDINTFPFLISRRFVHERYHVWGPKHPFFEARILGQFPKQGEDALISLSDLEASKDRELRKQTDQAVTIGIDVAGPGEAETVVYVVCGPNIISARSWTKPDPRGEVAIFISKWKDIINSVNIDSVGMGHYFAEDFKKLGFPVKSVNVGVAARKKERFFNLKAEAYWALRMRFEAGDICGLQDELTISQLAGIRYEHNPRGQVIIESKADAASRGVKSPDRAEALMLAFMQPSGATVPLGIGEGRGNVFSQLDPNYMIGGDDDEEEYDNEEVTVLDTGW